MNIIGQYLSIPSTDYLPTYMQQIRSIPRLTIEEEYELATNYINNNDINAAKKLVLSNLRFVVHVAKLYNKYCTSLSDLIQEGNIGLMKAVASFNPNLGVRLISYAQHWIKAAMREYIIRNNGIIRTIMTKKQRKIFFALIRHTTNDSKITTDVINHIASELDVSINEVYDVVDRMTQKCLSYDAPIDKLDNEVFPEDTLSALDTDPADLVEKEQTDIFKHKLLMQALAQLDERSLDIVTQRKLVEEPITFKELSKKYNVTHQRIEQIEKLAIKRIKQYFLEHSDAI